MEVYKLNEGGHDWEKKNLVTQRNRKGMYDIYECRGCGVVGKSYKLGQIEVTKRYANKIPVCTAAVLTIPKRIRITNCIASGQQFENLVPNSVHELTTPPTGYEHDTRGVWVMGVGEPVKVLNDEFEIIE